MHSMEIVKMTSGEICGLKNELDELLNFDGLDLSGNLSRAKRTGMKALFAFEKDCHLK